MQGVVQIPVVDLDVHHKAMGLSDRIALAFTKVLRFPADTFFAIAPYSGHADDIRLAA